MSARYELKADAEGGRPKKKANEIEVSYRAPEKSHEVIGRVWVYYQAGYTREEALELLRRKAARAGADGVILERTTSQNEDWMISHQKGDSHPAQWDLVSYQIEGQLYLYTAP